MEFNEKLQELRKKKALTQEELAKALYVSRTAISKWESGRGLPNIDSLKAISEYFSVTIDELLSCNQVLDIACDDNKQKENHMKDLIFGLLDLIVSAFFFLPFFGQKSNDLIQEVSLLSLEGTSSWLRLIYFIIIATIIISGILTLTTQNCKKLFWVQNKRKISLILNLIGVIVFIISSQPYAAIFLFIFLVIKTIMSVKKP